MSSLLWWLENELGGKHPLFAEIRENIVNHDQTCKSLLEVWLPRQGGVSCPSDLFDCSECGITLFNEGCYGHQDEDEWWTWYCECCYRRKIEQNSSALD